MIRKLGFLLVAALGPVGIVRGQQGLVRELLHSDGGNLGDATVSPDGKWLVVTRPVDNHEAELTIRAFGGGDLRVLPTPKGWHFSPTFTPQVDRLVWMSTAPQRNDADFDFKLVSAPFDTRNGTLTGPARQVSLDHLRTGADAQRFAISPDGEQVVYIAMGEVDALRVVPLAGGNARTVENLGPTPRAVDAPGNLSWSSDGRAVFYAKRTPDGGYARVRVALDGTSSRVVAQSDAPLGLLGQDEQHAFAVIRNGLREASSLRVLTPEGHVLGDVPILSGLRIRRPPVLHGKYLLGEREPVVGPMKVVATTGGAIRQLTDSSRYDWPDGWSADSRTLYVARAAIGDGPDSAAYRLAVDVDDGRTRGARIRLPGAVGVRAQNLNYIIYQTPGPPFTTDSRLIRMNLQDGSTREVAGPVIPSRRLCCDPVAAGGMYYGLVGEEFYYRQFSGDRMQVRAMNLAGTSRLLAEFPARLAGKTRFSVYRDRLAYLDAGDDSLRLRVIAGPRSTPRTIDAFAPTTRHSHLAWSVDGRQLFITLEEPQRILLYQFDASGAAFGQPRAITPALEYWYEVFWLPDGSGLTMIGQPHGMPMTHVVLVRLSDPDHPVLLTRDDRNNKWGHALSPDGKYVAYPSEIIKGGSLYLIDVAELLKRVETRD